jgi:hypothetical protein
VATDGAGSPVTARVEIESLNVEWLVVLAVTPPAINLPTSAVPKVSEEVVALGIALHAAGTESDALD